MRRTTVFADEADLDVLRAAAARQGVPESQLIREAIHRAALAVRRWDEPFFRSAHRPLDGSPGIDAAVAETRQAAADAYVTTRDRPA